MEENITTPEELMAAIESDEERIQDYFAQQPTREEFDVTWDEEEERFVGDVEAYQAAQTDWQQGKLTLPFTRVHDRRQQLQALGIDPYSFEPIDYEAEAERAEAEAETDGPEARPARTPPPSLSRLLQQAVMEQGMPVRKPKEHAMTGKKMRAFSKKLAPALLRRQQFYNTPAGKEFRRQAGQTSARNKK